MLPGVIYMMKQHLGFTVEQFRDGMLAAAAIAFIAKHNASIAGAEVGCQGEVGVASSMAAALIAWARCCWYLSVPGMVGVPRKTAPFYKPIEPLAKTFLFIFKSISYNLPKSILC